MLYRHPGHCLVVQSHLDVSGVLKILVSVEREGQEERHIRKARRCPAIRIAGSIGERGIRGERTSSQSSGLGLGGMGESKGIGGVGAASDVPEIAREASTNEEVESLIFVQ
jgi:hypothetical protein